MNEYIVKVIARKPRAFYRDEKHKDVLTAYVTETLECGHRQDYFFIEETEPLTAKRRACYQCAGLTEVTSKKVNSRAAKARIA